MTTAVTTPCAVAAAPTALRGQRVDAAVLAIPERCYRCGTLTTSIVGFLVPGHYTDDPDGFVDFELLARIFTRRVTAAQLARRGVGAIKMRRSRYRPEGYLSNGCIGCDAIQGWFPLHEDLMEFLSEGGTYDELTIGRWQLCEAELRACLRGADR